MAWAVTVITRSLITAPSATWIDSRSLTKQATSSAEPYHCRPLQPQEQDAILDSMLKQDPASRVAVETFVKTGMAIVGGEVTTKASATRRRFVKQLVKNLKDALDSEGIRGRVERRFSPESVAMSVPSKRIDPSVAS